MAEFDDDSSTESEYYDDGEDHDFDSSNGASTQAQEQSIAPSLSLSNDAQPELTPGADTRVSPTHRMRVETKEQLSHCRQVQEVDEASSTRFVSSFAMLAQLPTAPHANTAPSFKTFPTTSVSATSGNVPSTSERSHRPSLERLKTDNSDYSGPDEQLSQPLKTAPANVVSPASSDRSTRSRLSDTKSRESQTKHSEASRGAMHKEETRCSGCAMNLPSKYLPDSASTHQCTCCKRWLRPKEWFSESELAQSYDWRCIRCAEGHRLKRKRHEDEAYCDRGAKTFKKDDSGFRAETYARSELLALESERRDLNTTIRSFQDMLKIVRRLVNQQGKFANRLSPAEQQRHGIYHPVQRIITQNNSALARLRDAFTTKYTVIVSRLPEEERLQMFREEIPLLKLAVKYATAEIVAFSYLLRRCDQVLPTDVENFVVNYSSDKGSENAMEELVNSLTGQKAASVSTPKTSVEAGASRSINSQSDTVSRKQAGALTECPRCQGRFRISPSTQPSSTDKCFCDCCVRLLPESQFSTPKWTKVGPIRCHECSDERNPARLPKLNVVTEQITLARRLQEQYAAARRSWVSLLTNSSLTAEAAEADVMDHPKFKECEAKLSESTLRSQRLRLSCRTLSPNNNSPEDMERDRSLYDEYQNISRSTRFFLSTRLQLYVDSMIRWDFRLPDDLAWKIDLLQDQVLQEQTKGRQ